MKRSLLALVLVLLTATLHAAPPELASIKAPGLSVAVSVDGKIVMSEGVGFADLEQQSPARPTTRYRLGSVSKLFTAAIATRLAARGALDLDAPIQRYLPSYPHAVTARQLLGHLGGVRHYLNSDPIFAGRKYKTLEEGLSIFANDPLVAPPGTTYHYTSYGYNLLGVVLEKAGGKPFADLLADEVTKPLKLESVVLDDNATIVPGRASFYDRAKEDAPVRNAAENDSSYKWPSGGLVASAEDLVRFSHAWLQPGYLPQPILTATFTPQLLADGKATNVGLGWRINKTDDGLTYYHHGGTITGGRAFVLVIPEKKVAVAILTNMLVRYDEKEALAIARRYL
ncbi:MAG TPA: serine hydrolase domain-containing protein [Thermoanaerobaculia bacterium]|jgi:CubicO group peptidase (beta-lactamase class C family)